MSEETRERIIKAGAELIHRQGFHNTGLKDILKAADVPKGSFYFYFDSKEAFGIEMINHYGKIFMSIIEHARNDAAMTPLERLKWIFDRFHDHFADNGFTRGCPVGNLAQEMSDLSEPFRIRLLKAMDHMAAALQTLLDDAREAGEIPADTNTLDTAVFMVEAWHGAIIRMKVTKDGEPLHLFADFIFNKILK